MIKEYGSTPIYSITGEVTTEVSIPWAKDAEGKDVETWFTTDGQSLTQHVKHDVEGIVYPVTADPVWIPTAFVGFAIWAASSCVSGAITDLGWNGLKAGARTLAGRDRNWY